MPVTCLEVHRAAGLPLLVRINRLEESIRVALNGASLLLFTFDPDIRTTPPADMLMRMFSLTPVEADLAIAIAQGRRLPEIAAARGVKTETGRWHSKAAFAKTRTRGQVELTALLSRLAVLGPHWQAGSGQTDALENAPIFSLGELAQTSIARHQMATRDVETK